MGGGEGGHRNGRSFPTQGKLTEVGGGRWAVGGGRWGERRSAEQLRPGDHHGVDLSPATCHLPPVTCDR